MAKGTKPGKIGRRGFGANPNIDDHARRADLAAVLSKPVEFRGDLINRRGNYRARR